MMRSPDGDHLSCCCSRRGFLRKMGAAAGATALFSSGAVAAVAEDAPVAPKKGTAATAAQAGADDERKNVLFLVVDDLNTWLLGDPNRHTGKVAAPNIRRLAGSGVSFVRAYTASPKCSPSRTAILSGVSPWKSGVYQNGVSIDKSRVLQQATPLPRLFGGAGYYTASYGKIGHGWGDRSDWNDLIPHKRDAVAPNAPLSPAGGGECDWGPTHLAEDQMRDTLYADAAVKQLQTKHDRPFFIACGLFHPHMPWYVPKKYLDLFPLDDIALPDIKADDLADVPELARALASVGTVERIRKHGEHKAAVRGYLASTAYADAQMGRVLDALDASPYRDTTIVVLWSDHGFHLGEKSHWQKGTLWEEATHCLLMFRVPGMTRAGGTCERFVSLQDIYPTLADLCGLEPPDYVDGRSLVPLLKDPAAEWASTAISAYDDRYISIRDEHYRYIRYRDGQEEFYDCAKDPHEWANQIDNPEYAAAVKRLRASIPDLSDMSSPMPPKRR